MITTVTIEDVWLNPRTNSLSRSFLEVPECVEPPESTKTHVKSNHLMGVRTNVPVNHFIAALILSNEVAACNGKPAHRHSLRRKTLKEYPNKKKAVYRYFDQYSQKRKHFNQASVFSGMQRQPLYAWLYNEHGYIYHPIARVMMSFDDCRQELKANRVADPRFFHPEELKKIFKKRMDGDETALATHLPTQEEIAKLEKAIKKPLFRSITFAEGYGFKYR